MCVQSVPQPNVHICCRAPASIPVIDLDVMTRANLIQAAQNSGEMYDVLNARLEKETFLCPIRETVMCSTIMKGIFHFRVHVLKSHNVLVGAYHCIRCVFKTQQAETMVDHMKNAHKLLTTIDLVRECLAQTRLSEIANLKTLMYLREKLSWLNNAGPAQAPMSGGSPARPPFVAAAPAPSMPPVNEPHVIARGPVMYSGSQAPTNQSQPLLAAPNNRPMAPAAQPLNPNSFAGRVVLNQSTPRSATPFAAQTRPMAPAAAPMARPMPPHPTPMPPHAMARVPVARVALGPPVVPVVARPPVVVMRPGPPVVRGPMLPMNTPVARPFAQSAPRQSAPAKPFESRTRMTSNSSFQKASIQLTGSRQTAGSKPNEKSVAVRKTKEGDEMKVQCQLCKPLERFFTGIENLTKHVLEEHSAGASKSAAGARSRNASSASTGSKSGVSAASPAQEKQQLTSLTRGVVTELIRKQELSGYDFQEHSGKRKERVCLLCKPIERKILGVVDMRVHVMNAHKRKLLSSFHCFKCASVTPMPDAMVRHLKLSHKLDVNMGVVSDLLKKTDLKGVADLSGADESKKENSAEKKNESAAAVSAQKIQNVNSS